MANIKPDVKCVCGLILENTHRDLHGQILLYKQNSIGEVVCKLGQEQDQEFCWDAS